MRETLVVAGMLSFAVAVAGCGAGPGPGRTTAAAVDTVAGTERWLYPAGGGPEIAWTADTVAVIGGAMVEDDAYQFNEITSGGLAANAAGELYVLDRAGKRILKYDADGRHLASFGRAGGGPGELGMPIALAVGPGDSVWVTDIGNRRYTIFAPDGGDARNLPFDDALGFPGTELAVRAGSLIQDFRLLGLRQGGPGRAAPESSPVPIYRLTTDGTVQDTLWLSSPPRMNQVESATAGRVVVLRMNQAFAPQLIWRALSDGRIVVSDTADYILRLIDPDGTVVRRIDRDLPARETTEADAEAERERFRERMQGGGAIRITFGGGGAAGPPPEMIEAQLAAMTFAPFIPRITGVRVDPEDRTWVGVSLEKAGETERIDIYDRDGRLIGEVTGQPLPDAFLDGALAVRIVRDEFDVQQLVIYRIPELEAPGPVGFETAGPGRSLAVIGAGSPLTRPAG